MHLIWVLIVGAIIGAAAGAITKNGGAMGWISNILAGIIGSWLGEMLLGSWGPSLAGMALIPSLIGAIILVLVVSAVLSRRK
ncbi:putative membrane protein [Weissella oryzae SG25]|uniref:Putative membrane protein n=1 Tax=Weissella oryzae (strain DSM 25784 / JCM 18191 / LMG 30913 / SG25) TaxID=1329250 RepID=A0A069CTQ2_WEIOS|nr:GlsB/YeaQ/YmgE family stress response membrane protein [Weissella oryzae]GAK31190.1 putative membrane protein [Weissella oryzae SG25]